MKKLFLLGAIGIVSLSFAHDFKKSELVKMTNQIKSKKKLIKVQNVAVAFDPWWSVSFTNACGEPTTVFFQSTNEEASPAFNAELAYACNTRYYDCLN